MVPGGSRWREMSRWVFYLFVLFNFVAKYVEYDASRYVNVPVQPKL